MLVERSGEVVTKDELLGKVWNGSFVEEGNLPVQVGKLRRLLGENPTDRYIETVAGIGYRFNLTVDGSSNGDGLTPKDGNGGGFEAHRLYLKGKFLKRKGTKTSLLQAINYLQQSISQDPVAVEAYAEIIHCYCFLYFYDYMSFEETVSNIETYVAIADELGEGNDAVQSVLGVVSFDINWNFTKAVEYFGRALELNPSNLIAHRYLARLRIYSCNFNEALAHIKQVRRIDPMSVSNSITLGRLFYLMGLFDNSINHLNETLELDPENYIARAILGAIYIELADYRRAMEYLEQSSNSHENPDTLSRIGTVFALTGERDAAFDMIERINGLPESNSMNSLKIARIHAALGNIQLAVEKLRDAVRNREMEVLALKVEPSWKSLRDEPDFLSIIKALGIP